MKSSSLSPCLVFVAAVLPQANATVFLGTADPFAVLGGSTVVNTGASAVTGNVGIYPGVSATGFPPGIVVGVTYAGGAVAQQAQADALTAYTTLGGETSIQNLTGTDLGGLTLGPGVRNFLSTAQLTGILTLDAGGDGNARFDFQIGSTLTTAASSSLILINGARADNVYWRIGSSATFGVGTTFSGTLLANQSITLNSGTSLSGRALALNGSVTLDTSTIVDSSTIPEVETFWSLGVLCSVAVAWRWAGKQRQTQQALSAI